MVAQASHIGNAPRFPGGLAGCAALPHRRQLAPTTAVCTARDMVLTARTRVLAAAMTLTASQGLTGCQGKDEPPQPSAAQVVGGDIRVHELGEKASNGVFALSVLGLKTCGVEAHFQPPPGIRKLGVEVEISAVSEAEVPVNPFYGLVVDDEGDRFEPTLAGCQPVLEARRIAKGQSARGWISFDVPEDLHDARFRYAPVVIGSGTKQLEFALNSRTGSL